MRGPKVTSDYHLNFERFAFVTYSYHRVRYCNFPVWENICCSVKEFCRYLVQYLAFKGNSFWQYNVKGRNAVRYNHYKVFVINAIYIANLANIV